MGLVIRSGGRKITSYNQREEVLHAGRIVDGSMIELTYNADARTLHICCRDLNVVIAGVVGQDVYPAVGGYARAVLSHSFMQESSTETVNDLPCVVDYIRGLLNEPEDADVVFAIGSES